MENSCILVGGNLFLPSLYIFTFKSSLSFFLSLSQSKLRAKVWFSIVVIFSELLSFLGYLKVILKSHSSTV